MYVCRLDCEWDETPFPLQGVPVRNQNDIDALRQHCRYVFVDLLRRVTPDPVPGDTARPPPRTARAAPTHRPPSRRLFPERTYTDTAIFDDELPRAGDAYESVLSYVEKIVDDLAHGRHIDPQEVENAVRPMVESVLRSGDAFLWIESLRQRDSYTYRHAVSCSTLAAAFGRHMGFSEDAIVSLAAGGLLMDVGKSQLPDELLTRAGALTEAETLLARHHVNEGLAILEHSGVTDQEVLDMVRTHHERFNGTGYPEGLTGTDIPLAGRMAAIIDTYHAMSSPRPYRPAVSQHVALRTLYAGRNADFQAELVEQFQACIGVYPTGSLVELGTGEVAIVMVQNHARRLQPRVAILTAPDKSPLDDFLIVDLMRQVGPERRDIVRTLPPGSHGIDPKEYFLQ